MAAEVEVTLNHENGVLEKNSLSDGLGMNLGKENENIEISAEDLQSNKVSENLAPSGEAEVEKDGALTVGVSKGLNLTKKNGASFRSSNTKAQKDLKDRKVATNFPRNQKPNLSQSLSFPVRGVLPSGTKKNIIDKQINGDGKLSNGPATSTSRLNHAVPQSNALLTNVRASIGVNSFDGNSIGVSSRRTTLSSMPGTQRPQWGKSGSGVASAEILPSEILRAQDQNLKPLRKPLPNKDDEDTHSTTSNPTPRGSDTRRSSVGGFAFRCNERAEKRKEFFSKVEEKIHAKEVEKTNLQAKSKESQEQEIKQLRKSLTFKATPMPSFYQEPPPPKVDLKKLPTTRPRSPKLGRQKTMPASDSAKSPRLIRASLDQSKLNGGSSNSAADRAPLKKPVYGSLTKLPFQKSVVAKPDKKTPSSKLEQQAEKTCKAEPEEAKNNAAPENEIAAINSVDADQVLDLPDQDGKSDEALVEN